MEELEKTSPAVRRDSVHLPIDVHLDMGHLLLWSSEGERFKTTEETH